MKFRRILLTLQVWFRYRNTKLKLRRISRQFSRFKRNSETDLQTLKRFYEQRLADKDARYEAMLNAMLDRQMQIQRLMTVSYTALDSKERAAELMPPDIRPKETETPLTVSQQLYFDDLRSNYWEMGEEAGRTDAEIFSLWQKQGKQDAMQSVYTDLIPD